MTRDAVYLGGPFDNVGLPTGPAVVVSAVDGGPERDFPIFDGQVRALEPDGSGGWFVGGQFTLAGGEPRENLARVAFDGSLHPFAPAVDGEVRDLCLHQGVLYVAGAFGEIGGVLRARVAALDPTSGDVLPWNPADGAGWGISDVVFTLAVRGNELVIGGLFDATAGGLARSNLFAADLASGQATAWNPAPNSAVWTLLVDATRLFVGGNFTLIDGASRQKLAAFELGSGALAPFDPSPGSTVLALARLGGALYLGGLFTDVAGTPRERLAAVDAATGALLAWNPGVGFNDGTSTAVASLDTDGARIFAGGSFRRIAGARRRHVAALDPVSGQATAWRADVSGDSATQVFDVRVDGDSVGIGGAFAIVGGERRLGVAALDLTTGLATGWAPALGSYTNPDQPGSVNRILVDQQVVFLAGSFGWVNGTQRWHLAAVDRASGALIEDFQSPITHPNDYVADIAVIGNRLYVTGDFGTNAPGFGDLVALDARTGAVLQSFDTSTNGVARRLRRGLDGTALFIAGNFSEVGNPSLPRAHIAALDALTGAPLAWRADSSGDVLDLVLVDDRAYIGGQFLLVDGVLRRNAAAITQSSSDVLAYDPSVDGAGTTRVRAVAERDGLVYLGGRFDTVAGSYRQRLAATDGATGAPLDWAPRPNAEVWDLAAGERHLFVGGPFVTIAGEARPFFAVFDLN